MCLASIHHHPTIPLKKLLTQRGPATRRENWIILTHLSEISRKHSEVRWEHALQVMCQEILQGHLLKKANTQTATCHNNQLAVALRLSQLRRQHRNGTKQKEPSCNTEQTKLILKRSLLPSPKRGLKNVCSHKWRAISQVQKII